MQKLHVLSKIGSSFTRSLKSGSISLGCTTPDVILLPSAYYKVSKIRQRNVMGYLVKYGIIDFILLIKLDIHFYITG